MSLNMDPLNLIVCGTGGQGNILISRMIGRILSEKGYHATIGETFGAAQRGGAVYSSLRISKKRFYGPLIPEGNGHLVLSLEPLETLRILVTYGNDEIISVSNSEPIHPVGVLAGRTVYPKHDVLESAIRDMCKKAWLFNVTRMAADLGVHIVANIILLGGLVGINQIPITVEDVKKELRATFPESKLDLNLKALEMGMEVVSA